MKARKKSATFGFRAFVRNPCRYAPQSPVFFGSALSVGMKLPFSRNILIRRSGELHGEKRLRARGKHGGKPERDERRMKEDACRDPKHRRDPDPLPFRGASRQDIDGIHPREHIEEHSSREEPGVIFNAKHKVGISKE
jgi:hypothetical protein